MKAVDKDDRGDAADDKGCQRVHDVAAGADRDQTGQGTVVDKTGVVLAGHQRRQHAAHHGHQRVDRHQAGDLLQVAGAHHVEAEPADRQDPGTERQKGDVADRDRMGLAADVAPHARPEDQDRRQGDPAADGVDHHRTGIVMESAPPMDLKIPCSREHVLPQISDSNSG